MRSHFGHHHFFILFQEQGLAIEKGNACVVQEGSLKMEEPLHNYDRPLFDSVVGGYLSMCNVPFKNTSHHVTIDWTAFRIWKIQLNNYVTLAVFGCRTAVDPVVR